MHALFGTGSQLKWNLFENCIGYLFRGECVYVHLPTKLMMNDPEIPRSNQCVKCIEWTVRSNDGILTIFCIKHFRPQKFAFVHIFEAQIGLMPIFFQKMPVIPFNCEVFILFHLALAHTAREKHHVHAHSIYLH